MRKLLVSLGLISVAFVANLPIGQSNLDVHAAQCIGDQCPVPDHDELSKCYSRCDWELSGSLIFCQVASPDPATRRVCQSVAHSNWSGCYRGCLE